jgi:hypothetical protein
MIELIKPIKKPLYQGAVIKKYISTLKANYLGFAARAACAAVPK